MCGLLMADGELCGGIEGEGVLMYLGPMRLLEVDLVMARIYLILRWRLYCPSLATCSGYYIQGCQCDAPRKAVQRDSG
jgi:hypothetical protein